MTKKFLIFIPLFLTSCTAIGNWADGVGKHLPTIGEPCNHWQCFTDDGKKQSEMVKKQEETANKPTNPTPAPIVAPATPAITAPEPVDIPQ